jgi:hypothetical protein
VTISGYHLLLDGFFLIFDPEDGGDVFLENIKAYANYKYKALQS